MTTATTITLRSLQGSPLEDEQVRRTVQATAEAIAERQGITLLVVDAAPDRITVTLKTGRIEALGFAAELRRLTTNWYADKYGIEHLWGEVHRGDDATGEEWSS